MGIEATMAALTVALDNHTAALNAFVKSAGNKAGAGAAGAGTTSGSAGKTTSSAGAAGKAGGKKKITQDDVQKKFGDYLKVGDKSERDERLAQVKKINAHFGVPKMTEADPSIWPDAFAILDRMIEGEDLDDILSELGGGEGEDEDDGASVV